MVTRRFIGLLGAVVFAIVSYTGFCPCASPKLCPCPKSTVSLRSQHDKFGHGIAELAKFQECKCVSRWMRRAPQPYEPGQRWLAFLRSHREAIAAMDFFSVPT